MTEREQIDQEIYAKMYLKYLQVLKHASEIRIFCVISARAFKSNKCFLTPKNIGAYLDLSHQHVNRVIKKLIKQKIIFYTDNNIDRPYFSVNHEFEKWQVDPLKRKVDEPTGSKNEPTDSRNEPTDSRNEPTDSKNEPTGSNRPPPSHPLNIRDDSDNRALTPGLRDKKRKVRDKEEIRRENSQPHPKGAVSASLETENNSPTNNSDSHSSLGEVIDINRDKSEDDRRHSEDVLEAEVCTGIDDPKKEPRNASNRSRASRPKKEFEDYPEIAQRAANFWKTYQEANFPYVTYDALACVKSTTRLWKYYKWISEEQYEAFFRFITSDECWHHRNKVIQSFPAVFAKKGEARKIDKILANFETAFKNSREYQQTDEKKRNSIAWIKAGFEQKLSSTDQREFNSTHERDDTYWQNVLRLQIKKLQRKNS